MKAFARYLGLAIILSAAVFFYLERDKVTSIVNEFLAPAPCSKPISYSLGPFDTQFGISKSKFLADAARAAKIWEDAASKKLFTQVADGGLVLNLIYDYRQDATKKLQSIGIAINNDKATFDSLKLKYQSELSTYNTQKSQIESEIEKIKADKAAYEKEVDYWNSRGGAPKDAYANLEAKKNTINAEVASLNQKQASLNETADIINSLASVINELIVKLNLKVATYNSTSATTGEEFNEGEYIKDSSGEKINIYQYATEDKLIRVLAHELGHALGLDHVSDPKAIMYKANQSSNEKLTAADIAELKRVCGLK